MLLHSSVVVIYFDLRSYDCVPAMPHLRDLLLTQVRAEPMSGKTADYTSLLNSLSALLRSLLLTWCLCLLLPETDL